MPQVSPQALAHGSREGHHPGYRPAAVRLRHTHPPDSLCTAVPPALPAR